MEKRIQFLSHMVSRPHLCAWLLLPVSLLLLLGVLATLVGATLVT